MVYGRFGSKIRFENESDGRFEIRLERKKPIHMSLSIGYMGDGRSIGCLDDLDDASSCARKDGRESDQHDTGVLGVLACLWKPANVTKDRIPTAFYDIRHRAENCVCWNLGVPDVVLSTDLGYLALALQSLQASFVVILSMSHRELVRQEFRIPGPSLIRRGVDPSRLVA